MTIEYDKTMTIKMTLIHEIKKHTFNLARAACCPPVEGQNFHHWHGVRVAPWVPASYGQDNQFLVGKNSNYPLVMADIAIETHHL